MLAPRSRPFPFRLASWVLSHRLLGKRVCEKCEFEHPQLYALITATEAVERYGIACAELRTLRRHYCEVWDVAPAG